MGPTLVLRSRSSQALAVCMVGVSVLAFATAVQDGLDAVLQYGAAVALFGVLGWVAFWRPHVEVSDGGVQVANTWRTIEVPWPAMDSVEGRYGLRLRTAYGVVVAWGADAPVGRRRAVGAHSEASRAVDDRLEALRTAGYLSDPKLERPRPRTTWHVTTLATVAVLVVAAVVLPLIT